MIGDKVFNFLNVCLSGGPLKGGQVGLGVGQQPSREFFRASPAKVLQRLPDFRFPCAADNPYWQRKPVLRPAVGQAAETGVRIQRQPQHPHHRPKQPRRVAAQ